MKVCDILEKKGCVEEEHIERALKIQAGSSKPLEDILLDIGAIKEQNLKEALNLQSNLESELFSDKISFLESIEPFNGLDVSGLEEICETMVWKQFAAGETIQKEGTEGETFFIFKNGLARIFMEKDGDEKVIGFLGEGDFCGATALLSDGINPSSVVTIEQSLCIVQDKKAFAAMIEIHPEIASYFNELIIRQSKKIFTRLLAAGTGTIAQVEPFLYSKRARDIISPKQVFCLQSDTLVEVARRLVDGNVSTAVVVDGAGKLAGTIGLREIVEAALLKGGSPGQTVGALVEKDYSIINADNYFFDALHEMMKKGKETLIVMSADKIEGVLTSLDLLKFRGREVLSLIRNIEDAKSFDALNILRQDVESVLRVLISDGAVASHACKIVSELNDKVAKRVIRLAEESLGSPPVPFAWLGLGSEGRKEQTLLTDQDNAILFDVPGKGNDTDSINEYFMTLSDRIVNGLNQCGFPLCKGNIMATNPRYFGNIMSWKEKTDKWINISAERGEDFVDIYTFLDFRVVYGSQILEETLRSHIFGEFRKNTNALRMLARPIISVPVPLGFFKNFLVEKNGKYKDTVNIKVNGLLPLTTCVKLLAFYAEISEVNTLERIRKLVEKDIIPADRSEFIEQAFETFLAFKIHNNLNSLDRGREFSNNINPAQLGTKQKQLLKDSFLAVSDIQKITKDVLKVIENN
jgi:CBS domain-containing protein